MRKLRLYLETSIFGFCLDEEERNSEKRESVSRLFRQIKEGLVEGYVSGLVIRELGRSPKELLGKPLEIIRDSGIGEFDADVAEVESLAGKYVSEGIVPERVRNDAIHVALATAGEFDVLVTLNFEHIANEFRSRRFKLVNYREGYTKELSIRIPMEVLHHES